MIHVDLMAVMLGIHINKVKVRSQWQKWNRLNTLGL